MFPMPLLFAQEAAIQVAEQSDFMFGLDQKQRFVLLCVAVVFASLVIIALAGIVAGVYSSIYRRRVEAELKQDMLDRGMSAEEIAEVVQATAASVIQQNQRIGGVQIGKRKATWK